MSTHKDFEVEKIKSGAKDETGERFFHYKIYSKREEEDVREYCMTKLRMSYYTYDMPNPFVYELVSFRNLTELDMKMGNMYEYIVKKASTS